ncbi:MULTISPECIES: LacI family DNA-binding transcriptional regulator [Flavobacterium]|jgi:LacI family transcriptional regulator|uniref:LacI family DNA-binding transcriptional regulator n=1 Tax=Flavobacterium cupriresistens TaxID=2893885 RepID=A0ABU4RC95_9FLAO|nr:MULTISPECIES: LacI family DNA-binding transcriptional regulator [unclassified Flavobacterium]KLT69761.1 LacI family transcriptional regulator [Flavobacterium sp. ABG]MDX6189478.1 LacI family DNA-binding transcriptional regulator [Flavobacterium sp. Fl-318]UFH41113.1 LacI family transcriptional regulator [Flavobacterium sp. F-323]
MRRITIKDIATEAQVSISTVSFVINGKGEKMAISPAVIKKVQEVAEKLQYRPSMIASSLRTGKTRSIGLIVEDISNQFFADLARVIEDEAKNIDYRVFYCSTGDDDQRCEELVQSLLQANVEGFIITPTKNLEKSIDLLLKLQKPVVLIDRYFANQEVSHVVMDNYEGSYSATKFLINKGRKNIAVVNTKSEMIQMKLREKGYTDALKEEGIYDEALTLHLDYHTDEQSRIDSIAHFFQQNPKIDGVLFLANYMGLAGLQAFRGMGYRIPDDLSVISFDDHDSFKLHTPTISVVAQPINDIGIKSIELLMSQMTDFDSFTVEKVLKKGTLIVRESV